MLLTITTTHRPATDLGYLLHKNPARVQAFELNFGAAHVFYPEAGDDRATCALLLDVDPVGLVRGRRGPAGEGFALEQYVNDRPYVASSFLSVAIRTVFGSALAGQSKDRPELVAAKLPISARVSCLPCRGGEPFLRRLFEPLGYAVSAKRHELDAAFPEWGESPYYSVELRADVSVHDLLSHLYVLIPVLDGDKHYWVAQDEIEKLLRHGEGWLATHPEKQLIVDRYLLRKRHLIREALTRLMEEDQQAAGDEPEQARAAEEEAVERPISLNEQRLDAVVAALKSCGAKTVLDLGCSTGNLLRRLLDDKQFERIVGMDVSYRALEIAAEKVHLDRLPEMKRKRIELIQGSLAYRDKRLAGYDAAAVVEVVEHLDPPRLRAFERVLFEFARPGVVVMTTPNVEYNVNFPTLPSGKFRHKDHRFEWTREQFRTWAGELAARFSYRVQFLPIGPEDPTTGPPTQMAVFAKGGASA